MFLHVADHSSTFARISYRRMPWTTSKGNFVRFDQTKSLQSEKHQNDSPHKLEDKRCFFLLSNETALNENLTTAQEFIVPTETLILYFLCVILNKKTEKNNQAVLFSLQKKVFDINILDSFKMKGDWRNVKIKQAYKNKKDRNDTKTQTLNLVHWLNDMTMNTILKKTTLSNSP